MAMTLVLFSGCEKASFGIHETHPSSTHQSGCRQRSVEYGMVMHIKRMRWQGWGDRKSPGAEIIKWRQKDPASQVQRFIRVISTRTLDVAKSCEEWVWRGGVCSCWVCTQATDCRMLFASCLAELGVSIEQGYYIGRILPGSAAAKEGTLAVGDRILHVSTWCWDVQTLKSEEDKPESETWIVESTWIVPDVWEAGQQSEVGKLHSSARTHRGAECSGTVYMYLGTFLWFFFYSWTVIRWRTSTWVKWLVWCRTTLRVSVSMSWSTAPLHKAVWCPLVQLPVVTTSQRAHLMHTVLSRLAHLSGCTVCPHQNRAKTPQAAWRGTVAHTLTAWRVHTSVPSPSSNNAQIVMRRWTFSSKRFTSFVDRVIVWIGRNETCAARVLSTLSLLTPLRRVPSTI